MLRFCLCYLLIAVSVGTLGSDYNPVECGQYEISCKNGQCINKALWCDNVKDCKDGSDERSCKGKEHDLKRQCPPNFFRCNNDNCIPVSGLCDGYDSCGDSSDEYNCSREIDTNRSKHNDNHSATFEVQRPSLKVSPRVNSTIGFQGDGFDNDDTQDDYFHELDTSRFNEQERRAREWLLSLRKADYGWGDDTERAIVALSLSKNGLDANTQEEMLMIKQLHLKLSVALARNQTKMEPTDLALYINALQASCGEARNFYGIDLVSKLRDRVDSEHQNVGYTMPLVYLTLCLNNASVARDAIILQDLFLSRDELASRNDIQALVLLATICMKMGKNFKQDFVPLQNRLVERISKNLAGNVYEVALIFQALNAAKVNPGTWNRDGAVKFILNYQNRNGSFGDLLATYYVLPILSGKSLLSLGDHCNNSHSNDLTPIQVLGNAKNQIHVNYSLYFGSPAEMSQSMYLWVLEGTTYFDMMRLAQERNWNYRFSLDEKKDVPSVYSIGGVPNDAERGIYWVLYFKRISSDGHFYTLDMVPINDDLKKKVLRDGDNIIFWRKSI